jgi:hypothetical protein
MIIKKMLPGVLKELVKHVPTVLFKVVDWNELVSELPKISRRMLQKEGHAQLMDHQKKFLGPFNVLMTDAPIKKASHEVTKWSGESLLKLYFAQLFSSEGLFIDLRPQHFQAQAPEFLWHPSGLWTKFSESFRTGLLDVYEGFYLEDDAKYVSGLKQIGMMSEDWDDEDKEHLSKLFKAQFGEALSEEMSFELDHFRDAILGMSEFMLQKKVNISKDFLYLGIYLVTLYSHLDQSHEKYAVKEIYLAVKNYFDEKLK